MEIIAELVREALARSAEFEVSRAAGVQLLFEYGPTAVWLRAGDRVVSRIRWIRWWDPGIGTRRNHAAFIAERLVAEALERPGHLRAVDP